MSSHSTIAACASIRPRTEGVGRIRRVVRRQHARGAILLEVVLALVIFAAAATVIGIGLNSSIAAVDRLRLGARANDLSISVFSELQIGSRSLADTGPEPFGRELPGWTWEIVSSPWGANDSGKSALTRVEVIIRQEDEGFVHRATQVIKPKPANDRETFVAKIGGAR
jgi:type II secretory pathway pseudopilin PulG